MKQSTKHLFKSGVSLLLALCMVVSYPLTALAASTPTPAVSSVKDVNNDDVITYVSFGDSVTNGYGMEGYRFEDGTNVFGFRREPAASYPALIRDYLTEQGFEVDLEQMAISGFRMDELHWMLCDDYVPDSYHNDFFETWNRTVVNRLMEKDADFKAEYGTAYDGTVDSANKIIMTEYRDAVRRADLITIDLGTNNFGTFVTNTIQEILGLKELDYDIDFTQYMDANTAASLEAMLGQMIAGLVGASEGKSYDLALTLARCLMFGYLGYTENYDGAIEAIYELNPNVKIMVIDCYTMITGVELEGGALGENLDLDALYDMFIDLANFYSRELSPYANKVTHATLETAPELFIDYYKDYPDQNYPENQFLHPSAERLMNEFVMEGMGYDPDDPEEREQFQKDVLDSIQLLDSYVNNIQATVEKEVINGQIKPQIDTAVDEVEEQVDTTVTAIELIYTAVEGTRTAEENLPTAIEGVKAAREAVKTAVDGVALAQKIVDLIVAELIEGENSKYFSGSATNNFYKSVIISTIEDYVTDDLMIQAGFEPTDENRSMLAEEVYVMACVYYDELNVNSGTKESANRLAVLEGVRFMLVKTKGYSEADAQATAELAWELNSIVETQGEEAAVKAAMASEVGEEAAELGYAMGKAYEDAIAAGKTEDEAKKAGVLAGIAAALTEENMAALAEFGITDRAVAAELVYNVAKLYEATYNETEGDEAAKTQAATVKCMVSVAEQMGIEGIDEETATTGYQLYANVYAPAIDAGKTEAEAKEMTVIAAIKTQYPADGLAEAIYAIHKGTATSEQEKLAYITLMMSSGIPENVAAAIYACYAEDLDGQYNNENVKTTMIFLMVQALGMSQEDASENYDSYLTYKNLPTTLSKIAKCDTIYFDALLAATEDGLNLDAVAAEFMAGTLKLDKPTVSEEEDPEAWAEYKSDSALATLYFRFMTQDGIFTHPSEAGQMTLYKAAEKMLPQLLTAEPDEEIVITEDTNLLVLGDFIAVNENSYVAQVADKLGAEITNLSNADFRINDVRTLLDDGYAADAYAEAFIPNDIADYKAAVQNSDVILVNLGSMNMGMIAKQLALYMNEETAGQTYSMEFSTIDNMKIQNLGATMDGFLSGFSGAFGADATGALMLAFETYGYGYTTFADCLDNTIETIQTLNPEADIVLVGMYDLLGDAYLYDSNSGMYLEMGHFINHAVTLMNQHMMNYAEMTDNVTYVDVYDTVTTMNSEGAVNMMDGGVDGIAAAFAEAVPTDAGYASMAQKIACHLGGHSASAESITWTWAEDYSSASAAFTCGNCGQNVTKQANVTSVNTATCTEAGTITYTAAITLGSTQYTDEKVIDVVALGHKYETVVTAPTCTEDGYTTYTCSVCDDTYTADVVEAGHNYEAVVTAPTCTEDGYTTYTCSVCGDTYVANETAATGHNYGEDGKCACGATDPDAHPVCEYVVAETLVSGNTYMLTLGGNDVGSYTFTEIEGGWAIQAADGTYLALEDETLVYADQAFAWTYADGCFSAEVAGSSTGNNWFENIFGGSFGNWWGSSDETYYLVSSGNTIAVSTSNANAEAVFYTAHADTAHQFDNGVVTAPTCTQDGCTTYTCERCGYSYTGNATPALGHNYNSVVTAPTCTQDGYTTHTCANCGDSYVDTYIAAAGHDMVDGVCVNCGYVEGSTQPEGECTYLAEQTLTSGQTYVLTLGGTDVGSYTFTEIEGGWAIQTADGTYLALEDEALISSAEPFAWTYADGCFSAEVAGGSTGNNWFENIFGGSFGNWWGSSDETYYLVASGNTVAVSTSNSNATAKFYKEATGEHVYGAPSADNGFHVYTCTNCGAVKTEVCNNANCELCHPVAPEASIKVSVDVTSSSTGNNWFENIFGGSFGNWWGSSSTTYTATITVEADGTEVESVAYSTDGGSTWTEGTSFTSSSEITAFDIRVEASNGQTYYFVYSNGAVTEKV